MDSRLERGIWLPSGMQAVGWWVGGSCSLVSFHLTMTGRLCHCRLPAVLLLASLLVVAGVGAAKE